MPRCKATTLNNRRCRVQVPLGSGNTCHIHNKSQCEELCVVCGTGRCRFRLTDVVLEHNAYGRIPMVRHVAADEHGWTLAQIIFMGHMKSSAAIGIVENSRLYPINPENWTTEMQRPHKAFYDPRTGLKYIIPSY